MDEIKRNYSVFQEQGRIGQKKFAGVFTEEYLPELRGIRGIETYKEMAEGDDVIGAILFAVEMLIRQTKFDVEAQGDTKQDEEAAQFVKECMGDMQQTWQDTLSEILSFLVYGWSYHEICYKRRAGKKKDPCLNSKYNDGLIGWQKLPIRAQDTLWRWEYNEHDDLIGMSQMAPPDYAVRFIPIDKALHFITKSNKWNPEGKSILRNSYRNYYFKRRLQEIEGIGIERDLAGLPLLQPPEDVNLWDNTDPEMVQQLAYAESLVQNVRRDSKEGLVLPFGWTFSLLNGGSRRQFEVGTVIDRYDKRMATTVLADFIFLGAGTTTGSFALSSDKTELFGVALGAYLSIICDVFNNQAIPRLIDLNGEHFKGITDYPKLVHGDVESPDLEKMGTFIEKMTGVGLIVPDENLEKYVRRVAALPDKVEGDPTVTPEDRVKLIGYHQEQENTSPDGQNKPSERSKKQSEENTKPKEKKPTKAENEALKEKMAKAWCEVE